MSKVGVYTPGYSLSVAVTHPVAPASGDPVRFGTLTGIAETDISGGMTSCYFGPGVIDILVDDAVGGGIAVGDPLFFVDAATGGPPASHVSNDATGGGVAAYFFGFAMEVVGAGATSVINVLHVPSPGTGAYGAGSITSASLAAGSVTHDKLEAGGVATGIDGADLRNGVAGATFGVVPVIYRITCADAAADYDIVVADKIRVIDAWFVATNAAAPAAGDTFQIKNAAAVISPATTQIASIGSLTRIAGITDANCEIAAGGTLRCTTVKGGAHCQGIAYVAAVNVA